MRSLTALFSLEKDRLDAAPFNSAVFHFAGSVGDIYVADRDVTIAGVAHKGVIQRFGEFRSNVRPTDGLFQVNSIRLEITNFPLFGTPAKRFSDLWSGLGVEGVEVDVYQNLFQVSQGAVLQHLLLAGVLRPISYTPRLCAMEIFSLSEKYLDRSEISFPIARADFPAAAETDVGKRANIIYGSVKSAPAHAVKAYPASPLRAAMTTSSTTVPIQDNFHDIVASSGAIQIDGEKISYTGKGGSAGARTLTGLTRGATQTDADSHPSQSPVVFLPDELIYMAAGHALKAISAVYVEKGGERFRIDPARYTVELANTTLVSGKTLALVKFTAPPVVTEREYVETGSMSGDVVIFPAQAFAKSSELFEYTLEVYVDMSTVGGQEKVEITLSGVGASIEIVRSDLGVLLFSGNTLFAFFHGTYFAGGDGNRIAVVHTGVTVTYATMSVRYKIATTLQDPLAPIANSRIIKHRQTAPSLGLPTLFQQTSASVNLNFGAQEYPKARGKFRYRIGSYWNIDWSTRVFIRRHATPTVESDHLMAALLATGSWIYTSDAFDWEDDHFHNASDARSCVLIVEKLTGTFGVTGQLNLIRAIVEYDILNPAFVDGAESTELLDLSSAEMIVGGNVLVDCEGYSDDGSGTYTGAAAALIEKPADLMHHLARVILGIPASRVDAAAFVQARADAPASYKFALVISERTSGKTLLLAMGMQSRAQPEWPADKLTVRFLKTSYGAIVKTLTQENIIGEPAIERSAAEEIINVVNLYFDRDWSKGRGRDAFRNVVKAEDANSIAKYGRREQADRFLFDFVADPTMAADDSAFWLARLKEPARLIKLGAKLDEYELLPGDIIGLDFKTRLDYPQERFDGLDGTQKLLIESVGLTPGAARDRRPTRIALNAREVS